mmetsp:Transcript_1428/g.4847  ORF Transcript_1428/g.4847 Transcript_1428/m.4847 type:complete len:217 (+) Transcript_1428:204-854(+)
MVIHQQKLAKKMAPIMAKKLPKDWIQRPMKGMMRKKVGMKENCIFQPTRKRTKPTNFRTLWMHTWVFFARSIICEAVSNSSSKLSRLSPASMIAPTQLQRPLISAPLDWPPSSGSVRGTFSGTEPPKQQHLLVGTMSKVRGTKLPSCCTETTVASLHSTFLNDTLMSPISGDPSKVTYFPPLSWKSLPPALAESGSSWPVKFTKRFIWLIRLFVSW